MMNGMKKWDASRKNALVSKSCSMEYCYFTKHPSHPPPFPNHATHHIHGRAAECGRHDTVLQEPGEPEVGDLEPDVVRRRPGAARVVGQQDVLRLQVPVDDALGVEGPHGPRQLPQEQPDRVLRESPLG